jgi:hypothetical protein
MIEKRINHDFLFFFPSPGYISVHLFKPSFRLLPQLLPLNLVHEIEVGLVEVVDTDVTVLTTGGVCGAGGVHVDGVEGTEVTTDTANLVFEDLVVEARLELTLTGRGGCDIHGGLTTTEDNVVLLSGNGSRVEGGIGDVGLKDGEVAGRNELEGEMLAGWYWNDIDSGAYLGRLVFGSGDEVGAVGRELEVVDLVVELVGLDVLQLVTGLDWKWLLVFRSRLP